MVEAIFSLTTERFHLVRLGLWFCSPTVVTIRPTSKHTEDLAVDTTILSTLAQMSTTNDRQCDASNVSVAGWDYYNALLDENSKIVF